MDIGKMLGIFFVLGTVLGLLVFGAYLLFDKFFIEHSIKVDKKIRPKIELVIKNNSVDTVYVYTKP